MLSGLTPTNNHHIIIFSFIINKTNKELLEASLQPEIWQKNF